MADISLPTPGQKPWSLNPAITAINDQLNSVAPDSGTRSVGKGEIVVNALDYVTSSNQSNASTYINLALQAAASRGGGTVLIPRKLTPYSCKSSIILPGGVTLRGEDGVILSQDYWSDALVIHQGSLSATKTSITSSLSVGQRTVALSSASGYSPGDILLLGSDEAYHTASGPTQYKGELVTVLSISGNTLTLSGSLRDNYGSATGSVQKMNPVASSALDNLTIRNSEPGQHSATMIKSRYSRGFVARNLTLVGGDSGGVLLDTAKDVTLYNITGRDFTNNPGNGQYGYVVCAALATEDVSISQLNVDGARHAFTTVGVNGQRGVPRHIVVGVSTATRCFEAGFDTHEQGEDIHFIGCAVSNNIGRALQLRSRKSSMKACTVVGASYGMFLFGDAHDAEVSGCEFRNIRNDQNAQYGFGIVLGDALERVTIADNTIDGVDRTGIYINGAASGTRIMDNRVFNVGANDASSRYGVEFAEASTASAPLVIGNKFGTNPSKGNMLHAVRFGSQITGAFAAYNTAFGATGGNGIITGPHTGLMNARAEASTEALMSTVAKMELASGLNVDSWVALSSGRATFGLINGIVVVSDGALNKQIDLKSGGSTRLRVETNGNVAFGATGSYGGGVGVQYFPNATTVPASNPSSGGVHYVENGALKWRGSSGTVTTIAPA